MSCKETTDALLRRCETPPFQLPTSPRASEHTVLPGEASPLDGTSGERGVPRSVPKRSRDALLLEKRENS